LRKDNMASPTRKTECRRRIRVAVLGKRRKKAIRSNGSTIPSLPLTVPNANEKKQAQRKASAK